jgi:guanosine-3',5'-bis(diphosphate) 3'-pyrophosphohydrolase
MIPIAQTNLQLYEQIRHAGWPAPELARLRRAYDLCMRISAGQVRASGKPSLNHLVATAGIVARHTDRGAPVLAALLHASYTLGDFGDGRRGMNARKRETVRAAIGDEAERIVARYAEIAWTNTRIADFLERADVLDAIDRDVALIRVANALEDHSDLGMRYRGYSVSELRADPSHELTIRLASALGFAAVSGEIAEAIARELEADVPVELIEGRRAQFEVAPMSYRRRFAARLSGQIARLRRCLGRLRRRRGSWGNE